MSKKIIAVFILFSMFSFLACPLTPGIVPNPPEVTDQHLCASACQNLQKLGCEEGQPIVVNVKCSNDSQCSEGQSCKNGKCYATCERFCIDTENAGVWLKPKCLAEINSCNQIEKCQ